MHPQQSPPQLPDSGSAGLSSTRLQIVQYSGLLLFVIISLPKRPVLADFCLSRRAEVGQKQLLMSLEIYKNANLAWAK
jgi:hypothetical protein